MRLWFHRRRRWSASRAPNALRCAACQVAWATPVRMPAAAPIAAALAAIAGTGVVSDGIVTYDDITAAGSTSPASTGASRG